ncbi:MAG: hypothetical protein ING72_05875 [Methylobacterium sp.]|nr:hypothetical protein [Methylobacterium sp.]MCA4909857.1 hypothetical protein [Methylobacterium sp.]
MARQLIAAEKWLPVFGPAISQGTKAAHGTATDCCRKVVAGFRASDQPRDESRAWHGN